MMNDILRCSGGRDYGRGWRQSKSVWLARRGTGGKV